MPKPAPAPSNPFRIHGIVAGEHFTDRDREIARFRKTLEEPAAKLLVSGYRRMGKTSTLARAVAEVNAGGGHAILADLSTATTVADMANRILEAAGKALGRRWTSLLGDLAQRFQAGIKLTPDPATGMTLPSLELGLRQESLGAQQASLGRVLDTLNELAGERGTTLGVVLDEFQEITRFGAVRDPGAGATARRTRGRGPDADAPGRPDQPEWHLRGLMQEHQHLSYILAGSKPALLRAMTQKRAAFYDLLDPFAFGPIDAGHMADWIDGRLQHVGREPVGAGRLCVDVAGPRTRDIVRLARKCVDRTAAGDVVDAFAIEGAFREIVDEEADRTRGWWERRSALQQNALRAVAAEGGGLTTREVRRRFALTDTGGTSNTLKRLVADGELVRSTHGSTYVFDDPFVRGWVVANALRDVGITDRPITFVATRTDEYDQ